MEQRQYNGYCSAEIFFTLDGQAVFISEKQLDSFMDILDPDAAAMENGFFFG